MSEQYIYGFHAVTSLISNPNRTILKLFTSKDKADKRLSSLLDLAIERMIPVETLSTAQFNQEFANFKHQGIVALAKPLDLFSEKDLVNLLQNAKKPPLILILDGVTDPHNFGACLRSCDATGVDFVIIPKDRSVGITPVVSKVACGGAETIPIVRVTNLVRTIEMLKESGVWIYGAAGESQQSIFHMDFKGPVALVMGSEGEGMRRLTKEHCDNLFSIPMLGMVESLNISVAAGICLFETLRQRTDIV